jgi:hypothetical protein
MLFKNYYNKQQPIQFLAQLRFEYDSNETNAYSFRAYVFNERKLCCGRNFMVLPSSQSSSKTSTSKLSVMTFPDPVWIQTIDTQSSTKRYDLNDPEKNGVGPKLTFHGTSGHLLYSEGTDEYIGIIHAHRDIDKGRFIAKFGHHYTHAFFAISSRPPYELRRLSQEFVFPSKAPNLSLDADVVQFASGLEWVPGRHQVAIGYGINDCEAAVVYVGWDTVDTMLRSVANGTQVVDTMKNATIRSFFMPTT